MFTVCITVQDDGKFKVYTEPMDEMSPEMAPMPEAPMESSEAPMPEMPAEVEDEEPGQVFSTVKEALLAVMEAIKNEGKVIDNSEEDAGFQAAFQGAK